MTPAQFASLVRFRTGTDSSSLSDANLLLLMNAAKDTIAEKIVEIAEDYFGTQWLKDLVADQRDYAFPEDMIKFKKSEAMLDGANFVSLHEYDMAVELRNTPMTEAQITALMSGNDPAFDIFGDQFKILSADAITNVTDGLAFFGSAYPADVTDLSDDTTDLSVPPSSTTYGMPRPVHDVWLERVVIEWKNAQTKPIPLNEREINHANNLKEAINSLRGVNQDRPIVPKAEYNDGSQY